MAKRQVKHSRISKKGKRFTAGKGRKRAKVECSPKLKREIIKEYRGDIRQDLKKSGRARIPDVGILRINIKKATKERWGIRPGTTEKMRYSAKPKRRVIKFRAAKALKDYI